MNCGRKQSALSPFLHARKRILPAPSAVLVAQECQLEHPRTPRQGLSKVCGPKESVFEAEGQEKTIMQKAGKETAAAARNSAKKTWKKEEIESGKRREKEVCSGGKK